MFTLLLCYFSDPPDNPIGPLKISNILHTEVTLSWKPPDNRGGLRLTGYIVEKRENKWVEVAMIAPEKTECLVQGLTAGSQYYFQVRANNSKGSSRGLQTVKPVETLQVTGKLEHYFIVYSLNKLASSLSVTHNISRIPFHLCPIIIIFNTL